MHIHANKYSVLNSICADCSLLLSCCLNKEQNFSCDSHVPNSRLETIFIDPCYQTEQCEITSHDNKTQVKSDTYFSGHLSNDGSFNPNRLNDTTIANNTMRPSSSVNMHATLNNNSHCEESNPPILSHDDGNISSLNSQSCNDQSQSIQQPNNIYDTNSQQNEINQMNLGFKCKGFRIGHINIQGLGNKIDHVKLLLGSSENQIQILGLSETKLKDVHPGSFLEINGYQKPFRRDRKQNAGGGLLVFVKNGVS